MYPAPLPVLHQQIVACARCPRLRQYCERVAREKKRAHRDEVYWGRPVPGFGDPAARLWIVGLAPAAHGANRTGRVFTGDSSGDFLMRALHRAGFANIPSSTSAGDGLRLSGAFISAAARCAPPDNKPLRSELDACFPWLLAEFEALHRPRVIVALGRIGFGACLRLLRESGLSPATRPAFAHGAASEFGYQGAGIGDPGRGAAPGPLSSTETRRNRRAGHQRPDDGSGDGRYLTLIASYHPSRQNTNTGRLTEAMFDEVFEAASRLL